MERCINLDWLELYCLEDYIGYPHDANFFRCAGYSVRERDYGTPVYHEMFTILDHAGEPLIEVRRNPKSAVGRQLHGVLDPMSCHVRLHNRTCYFQQPVQLIQEFIERYGLHYQRISRVDICLDFVKFDYGDDPAVFMARYMRGRYSKINQANIAAHGSDRWDGRTWNSVSWGDKKSMIGTKFYNKKLELMTVHDKPYIRQAWRAAGLIDDDLTLVKYGEDGVAYYPDIWRVEFSIKSSTRNWYVIEDNAGKRAKIRSIRNTLECYDCKQKLLDMFFSLAEHYFHFKKYEAGKRKDRCEDKLLFKTNEVSTFYKLENVATTNEPSKALNRLYAKILEYSETVHKPEIYKACAILLEDIDLRQRTTSMQLPWNANELTALRLLIAKRIKSHNLPLSVDKETIEALLQVETSIFGEKPEKQAGQ